MQFKQENRDPFATVQTSDDIALESDELLDISSTDDMSAIIVDEQVDTSSFQPTGTLLTIETNKQEATPKININITPNHEIHTESHDEPQLEEEQENSRKPFPIWLPIVILIVLAMGVGGYLLFFGDNTFKFFKKKNVIVEQQIETPAPVINIPVDEISVEVVQETPVVQQPVISGTQHHIILGSFTNEGQANQLMTNLQGKGYSQASFFAKNSYFLVSVEYHASLNKTLERQEQLLDELRMESWVISLR